MKGRPFLDDTDSDLIRGLLRRLGPASTVVDFEESIQLESVRSNMRLWFSGDSLKAFAFVDDWDNLWYDADPSMTDTDTEDEAIVAAVDFLEKRNSPQEKQGTLDANCEASNTGRIAMLARNGFKPTEVRTLKFEIDLSATLPEIAFPAGYSFRVVTGEREANDLVSLHRAVFGTENMTLEERLAMMRTPAYDPSLDFVALAPDGSLAGFCVCGVGNEDDPGSAFADPVGIKLEHARKGLGKALLTSGLKALKAKGALRAGLGTENVNIAMRKLAESAGFRQTSEKIWFSKPLT